MPTRIRWDQVASTLASKDMVPGVSFAGDQEIATSSTVLLRFGTMTSLARVGDLGIRASITDVVDLGAGKFLEDILKIGVGTSLAYSCRIGIETPLAGVGDLGAGASLADVWRVGAAMSLIGFWSWPPLICRLPRHWHRRNFTARHQDGCSR